MSSIKLQNENDLDVWIQNTDQICLFELKKVQIDIGEIEVSQQIDCNRFHEFLSTLKNVEKISINFINLNLKVSEDLKCSKIEFPNLKSLVIKWKSGEKTIHQHFLKNIQTSCLEELVIDLPFQYELKEAQTFFEFLNKNSNLLQKAHIWSKDHYGFDWNPKYVEIWSRDDIKSEILKFMENRIGNLETFKLHWLNDSNFISEVFEWAPHLKHFETSERCSEFCGKKTYPNIRKLTLWIFGDDSEDIKAIHSTFPDISSFRLAYSRITKKNIVLIRELFTDLEEIIFYEWMRI